MGDWKYTYYATGQLKTGTDAIKTVTDAKGQIKSFEYDNKLDRLTKKYVDSTLQADGTVVHGTLTTSFIFDDCPNGIGRLCHDDTVNNPQLGFMETTTRYTYDIKGRLISEMKTIEGTRYTTSYAYDSAGRQKEIFYPDSDHEKVTYTYNDAGLLNNVANPQQTYLSSTKYNALRLP